MRALAPLSHVVVKASQLQYIHAQWQQPHSPEHALLKSLVREVSHPAMNIITSIHK
jgi:hypothetical protein